MPKFMQELDNYLKWYGGQLYDPYCHMAYDILKLFKLTYQSGDFFEILGKQFGVIGFEEWLRKEHLENERGLSFYDDYLLENEYKKVVREELMTFFKDFAVQYLGYDSIDRFTTNYEKVNVNRRVGESPEDYIARTPRIIVTSSMSPNERFYNYLLMGWSIQRVPKFIFNENLRRFEKESNLTDFYTKEKEEILGKEIQSVKRLVPLSERHNYFKK